MTNEILSQEKFKKDEKWGYYMFREKGVEICIEPCSQGFDVGIYRSKNMDLMRKKFCTQNLDEIYDLDILGKDERTTEEWEKAIRAANEFYWDYIKNPKKRYAIC